MLEAMWDYYAELEVSPGASSGVIAAAYRHLARVHHPDVAGAVGARRMRALNEAYETLRDPDRRRAYDAARAGESVWEPDAWPSPSPVRAEVWRPGAGCYLTIIAVIFSVAGALWAAVLLQSRADSHPAPLVIERSTTATHSPTRPQPTVWLPPPIGIAMPAAVTAVPMTTPAGQPAPATPSPTSEPSPEPSPEAAPGADPSPPPTLVPAPSPARAPLPPPALITVYVRHLVQAGENLSRIAEQYGVTQAVIMAVNGLLDPDRILFGQELLIPQQRRP